MKHKAIRKDNLMYKGCEPHWQCVICGDCVPFHCWSKEEYEQQECKHGTGIRTEDNDET